MTAYEMIQWLVCFDADDEVVIRQTDESLSDEYHFEERMDGCEIVIERTMNGSN